MMIKIEKKIDGKKMKWEQWEWMMSNILWWQKDIEIFYIQSNEEGVGCTINKQTKNDKQ